MSFTEKEIESLAKEHFGIDANAKALTGEYEFNFLLTATDGTKFYFQSGQR